MISKPIAVGLLAVACATAAVGGGYIATRQNEAAAATPVSSPTAAPAAVAAPTEPAPVAETETFVEPRPVPEPPAPAPMAAPPSSKPAAHRVERTVTREREKRARATIARPLRTAASERAERPMPAEPPPAEPEREAAAAAPPIEPVELPRPDLAARSAPRFEELVIPASAVVGLQVETPLSSETAKIEDRVEARVTRDLTADGRVAIPSGTRALGSVVVVERGGKVKERARLGVRFHTLVLADGTELPIRTDAVFREGESPTSESARKIGGATIGGAILGAIMGGKKGAVLGGATGAAGGTAAVMAGGRNAATIAAGTVLTVRLASPVTVEVERR